MVFQEHPLFLWLSFLPLKFDLIWPPAHSHFYSFSFHQSLCVSFVLTGNTNSPSRHFSIALTSKLGHLYTPDLPTIPTPQLWAGLMSSVFLDFSPAIISSPANFFTWARSLTHSSKSRDSEDSTCCLPSGAPSAARWFLNSSHMMLCYTHTHSIVRSRGFVNT